jgi:hypothetical protein
MVCIQASRPRVSDPLVQLLFLPAALAGKHGERFVYVWGRVPMVTERDAQQSLEIHGSTVRRDDVLR